MHLTDPQKATLRNTRFGNYRHDFGEWQLTEGLPLGNQPEIPKLVELGLLEYNAAKDQVKLTEAGKKAQRWGKYKG